MEEQLRREAEEAVEAAERERLASIQILSDRHWDPDREQPPLHCFLCRSRFNVSVKAPMRMQCQHTVCKECVIDRESQHLSIICFYDGSVYQGLYQFSLHAEKMKLLSEAHREKLDSQLFAKVRASEVSLQNPSAHLTRHDLDPEGVPLNVYLSNPHYNRNYLQHQATKNKARPKAVTIDDLFDQKLFSEEAYERPERPVTEQATRLQELERQKNEQRLPRKPGPPSVLKMSWDLANLGPINGRTLDPRNAIIKKSD